MEDVYCAGQNTLTPRRGSNNTRYLLPKKRQLFTRDAGAKAKIEILKSRNKKKFVRFDRRFYWGNVRAVEQGALATESRIDIDNMCSLNSADTLATHYFGTAYRPTYALHCQQYTYYSKESIHLCMRTQRCVGRQVSE